MCSPSCADARVRQSSSLSYQVTGEEQERRQRAAGATNVHDRLAKASAAEMTARCVRCSAEMTLHVGTEAGTLKSLKALGWHALGNGWACSKLCKEWLAGPVAEDAVKPVTVLADAEYQRRRAQGGNPRLAALPDPAAKSKGAR